MKKIIYVLVAVIVFFTSCVSSKSFLKNDQIPDDFGKGNKTILIVPSAVGAERLSNNIDKAVLAAFEKYYKGEYFHSGDYKKAKTVDYTFTTYFDYQLNGFYFGVKDMESKKEYKMQRLGNFKKYAKLYVQALEIVRKRNNSK